MSDGFKQNMTQEMSQNFYWGECVNNEDPLMLGRVRVRPLIKNIDQILKSAEKKGFSAPDASWFKGESIEYVRHLLYHPNARIYNFLDRSAVQILVNEHLEGDENRRLFIWSLLNFEWWLRKFMDEKEPV